MIRRGRLLVARAAIADRQGGAVAMRLLVDTGSNYPVLPVEVLEAAGCDTHHPVGRVQIVTANGTIVAPRVELPWFQCLGRRVESFSAVAHTLPPETSAFRLFFRPCSLLESAATSWFVKRSAGWTRLERAGR